MAHAASGPGRRPDRATPRLRPPKRRTKALRRTRQPLGVGALALLALCATTAQQTPVAAAPSAPRDPNELPRMRAPLGQPQPDEHRVEPRPISQSLQRRRVQLTVMPLYASLLLPYVGRNNSVPLRGAGAAVEVDVELYRPLGIRVMSSYSGHPLQAEFATNSDDDVVEIAPAGQINALWLGASAMFAAEYGRIRPTLDVGLGVLMLRPPTGGSQAGQLGQQCTDAGGCDPSLVCSAQNVCEQSAIFEVHGGIGIDVMLGRRWAVGGGLRYFALLSSPGDFPVYLHASTRLAVRF